MRFLRKLLFPKSPRKLAGARGWNIAARTVHIGVSGVLVGGHVFEVPAERLLAWLYATILSGAMLIFLEAYSHGRWLYEGRGAMVFAKLGLLCLVPAFWEYRVAILACVVVLGSVGSHMPARFRYYSLLHRRVLDDPRKSRRI
jgi:hypothetical protein